MNASGTIATLLSNRGGEVDGCTLSDGTLVKFPPHFSKTFQERFKVGGPIEVQGKRHETREGEIHLHAQQFQIGNETVAVPPPHPKKHGSHQAVAESQNSPASNEAILDELRAVRKLLETRN